MLGKVYCSHCGRQLVNYEESDKYCVSGKNAVRLFGDQYCCSECNEYDENGLLPEERG